MTYTYHIITGDSCSPCSICNHLCYTLNMNHLYFETGLYIYFLRSLARHDFHVFQFFLSVLEFMN